MTELLNNYLHIIVTYFPLGIIGIWRWSVWIFKKVIAWNYKPIKSNGYNTTLSIVTPVYNENPELFRKALESWKQNKPEEIIAVIDYSDQVCIKEFEDFSKTFEKAKLIITQKPGKRPALGDGVKIAASEIVALVDSDTVWDNDIREIILAPFFDSAVGGVGTRQDVLETDTLAKRLFNIHLDQRYFDEIPFLAKSGDALACLSGRTAVYRKKAIMDLVDNMINETFWGKKCISGEDKCLTRLVQAAGWKTRYQINACVRTSGMPELLTFFKQQTRWIRNSWRSDFKSLASKWIWQKEKILAFHMVDRFIQPFTLTLGLIYFVLSIIWGHYLIAVIILVWWHLSRVIKIFPHLRHRPSDLFILPAYVLTVYIMGVVKIYAFFTINKQGWLTRWDKNRLGGFKYFKLMPAYTGTAAVIFLLGFGVVNYRQTSAVAVNEINFIKAGNTRIAKEEKRVINEISFNETGSEVKNTDVNERKQTILNNLENQQFGYYTVKKNDTLSKIAQRYNGNLKVIIEANKTTIQNSDLIKPEQLIIIPVSELRNILDKNNLVSRGNPKIVLDQLKSTIIVEGEESVVTLPEIYDAINNELILQKLDNKEWRLNANLFIRNGATLVLDGKDISWLKLKSNNNGFVWLRSSNGNILIQNTKITSWDEIKQSPDVKYEDGRSFVLAEHTGRMDVINSELAFLGYEGDNKALDQISGGLYGVSWKISSNTFKENLITGSALYSKFHDNYFGIYTYGATGMIIENNEVFNNIQYGIDPHSESNNLIIKGNRVYSNGNHGIIISAQVFNNHIIENISYKNKLHGVMLDRQSNNNLVENNIIYENVDGIAIHDSHNNLIKNNEVRDGKNGIRVNDGSSNNYFEQNKLANNENSFFIYDNANNNFVTSNFFKNNTRNFYIKNAIGNFFKNNVRTDY